MINNIRGWLRNRLSGHLPLVLDGAILLVGALLMQNLGIENNGAYLLWGVAYTAFAFSELRRD